MRRLVRQHTTHGPSVGRKGSAEALDIIFNNSSSSNHHKAWPKTAEEAASSEASTAQMSLQVPSLVAWSVHKPDRSCSEERTHLPLLEGAAHLQLRLVVQYTNARSTLLSKSSTNIDLPLQRTQETPADSITRWRAHTTANRANKTHNFRSRTMPPSLEAVDCDQASASQELALMLINK